MRESIRLKKLLIKLALKTQNLTLNISDKTISRPHFLIFSQKKEGLTIDNLHEMSDLIFRGKKK